jgi:hypothetical protein
MFNRNFFIGITVGLICVSLIGMDLYKRINQPVAAVPTEEQNPAVATELSDDNGEPEPLPSVKGLVSSKSSPTPTPRVVATVRPSPTPTPTPRPLIDYYVQSHSQILVPENRSDVTEFVESQVYPRMRLQVDFAVNNARVGDTVELKIYDDGQLQQTASRTVSSTTNFHFSEVFYAKARPAGDHSVKFVFNENRAVQESNYGNNEHTFTYKITKETEPPTFTIDGPYLVNGQTCMRWINLVDNVSVYTDVWARWNIDNTAWSSNSSGTVYGCISGTPGSTHTYYVHAEDRNGNVREDSRTFTLY